MNTESLTRKLDDIIGGPYIFELKPTRVFEDEDDDKGIEVAGLKLMLDEWTIDAEKWAKANWESMQNLFNKLMRIDCDDEETIDAAVSVAAYKLTDHSRRKVDEVRGDLTTEDFIRKNITYKLLAELCLVEYAMIKDSIPIDLIEEAQKKSMKAMNAMTKTQAKTKKRKPKS